MPSAERNVKFPSNLTQVGLSTAESAGQKEENIKKKKDVNEG